MRPKTLRGRLALFCFVAMMLVLGSFAATLYLLDQAEDAAESPAVKALEPDEQPVRKLIEGLVVALPVAIAAALLGASWVARRGLSPLDDVVATATRVGAENLHERIPVRPFAAEEIGRLVGALNHMLDRLERSVAGMRRFTADASHELRTPLAALLGDLEISLRHPRSPQEQCATIERALEELGKLSRLVEALLTLAHSDAGGLPMRPEPLDLVTLAHKACEPYQEPLAARNIRLRGLAGSPRSVKVLADPLWTQRAIANLLDNACKFTPDGGEIAVAVRVAADQARFEIHDSGPGVAAGEREQIFERFYRGESARSATAGAGLGLAIAREIARAQAGDLQLEPTAAGARFVFRLPLFGESADRG